MYTAWKDLLWKQFGGTIDMLENAITACPEKVWSDRSGFHECWYMAYHTLFFLDYYLSDPSQEFTPPLPFTLSELDPAGKLPDRVYTKAEMLTYLTYGREKCRVRIAGLTKGNEGEPCRFELKNMSVVELLLYNMRHVQHHAAQLNLLLRQRIDSAPNWVGQTKTPL